MSSRRFAVSRLHLNDGTVLYNQVVEETDGRLVRFYDLTEELHSTEWRDEDFYLSTLLPAD